MVAMGINLFRGTSSLHAHTPEGKDVVRFVSLLQFSDKIGPRS